MSEPVELKIEGLLAIAWADLVKAMFKGTPANPQRLRAIKAGFYAGADVVMGHVLKVSQEPDSDEEAGIYRLSSIHDEIHEYNRRLLRGEE